MVVIIEGLEDGGNRTGDFTCESLGDREGINSSVSILPLSLKGIG